MRSVLLGLLQGPVAWLLISLAISTALQVRLGATLPATIGVSLLAGGFAWASIGLLASAMGRWRERAALTSGIAGLAPRDGANAVLVGTAEATGPVLRAPLDGSPCVAYTYEIVDDRGTGKRRFISNVARGVALTPTSIVTRTGSYRLLAVPALEASEPGSTRSEMIANFQRYAGATRFVEQLDAAAELIAQWQDSDGEYRSDVRYPALALPDTSHWVLRQQHVPPGSPVCVFGRFSQAQGAVVAPRGGSAVRLVRGNVDHVAAGLLSKARFRLLFGLAFGGAAAGLLWTVTTGA